MQSIIERRAFAREAAEYALRTPPSSASLATLNDQAEPPADRYLVSFAPGDRHNPQAWSKTRKWMQVILIANIALLVGVAAAVNSGAAEFAKEELGVSSEVISLDTALFLIGFGVSSPFLAPLSELGGRNPVYLITIILFSLFEVGAALSPNIGARLALRFLAGLAGSTPLGNAGASIADMFNSSQRTYALPAFATIGLMAPAIGPVMGGFIGQSYLGYKWCDWITAIWGFATAIVSFLFMPETLADELLKMKAKELRRATGDDRYRTALERTRATVPFKVAFVDAAQRPFKMLVMEPIVVAFSLYMTLVYVVLFGNLVAYPYVFATYDLNAGLLGLTFIPIALGIAIVGALIPFIYKSYLKATARAVGQHGEGAVPPPEERLKVAMIGTWLMPISLFWLAWTCDRDLTIWPALVSQIFFGMSILCCFISSYQYIIDSYLSTAASALSDLTLVRYIMSGVAVIYTGPMFEAMGPHHGMTVLACVSFAFCFVPFGFYVWGPRIRSWSRYTPKVAVNGNAVEQKKEVEEASKEEALSV